MPRYVAKPRACGGIWYEEEETFAPGLTVYDDGDESEATGILDASGNEYHRLRGRCGFVWSNDG